MIINAWDSFCVAENGCDWDSDILFSTNNAVLKRRYRELPAIECVQRNTSKVIVTENEVKKTNKNGMGNQVGTITNYVTSMMEVQSHFEKGSKEYLILRILKLGILPEITPLWAFGNDFSSFQAVC